MTGPTKRLLGFIGGWLVGIAYCETALAIQRRQAAPVPVYTTASIDDGWVDDAVCMTVADDDAGYWTEDEAAFRHRYGADNPSAN